MSGGEEEVFLDAEGQEEEVTARRSSRKRRSTAGGTPAGQTKKARAAKMPCGRSPGKPSKAPPDGSGDQEAFWKKMESILGGLETRMKAETAGVREILEGQLSDLKGKVESQEKRMDDIVCRVEDLVERKVEEKLGSKGGGKDGRGCCGGVSGGMSFGGGGDGDEDEEEEIVERAWGSPSKTSYAQALGSKPKVRGAALDLEGRRERQYWERRRAVRLRPVGDGNDMDAVKTYLRDHLKIGSTSMASLGLERASMERVPFGPSSKIKNEMIVRFPTVEARDLVKASARNLASKGQEYGVRHELPDHLKTAMGDLQALSYELKKKHPDVRRNVLFDDGSMDLVLDFCTEGNGSWKRITSAQARKRRLKGKGLREDRALDDDEIDILLGAGGGGGQL